MPLYDYQCRSCQKTTEVRHGFKETFEGACPACGSTDMARVYSPAGIVFKGSGFYLTDSRKASEASPKVETTSTKSDSAPAPAASTATPAPAAAPAAPAKSESAA